MSVCHQANTPFTRTFYIHSLPNTCVCVCSPQSPSFCVFMSQFNDICSAVLIYILSSCQRAEVNSADTVGSQESRKCDQQIASSVSIRVRGDAQEILWSCVSKSLLCFLLNKVESMAAPDWAGALGAAGFILLDILRSLHWFFLKHSDVFLLVYLSGLGFQELS